MKTSFVILAGGSGKRLWPLSQPEKPKQLISFMDGTSLLEQTLARIKPLTASASDVHVVTHQKYLRAIQEHLNDDKINLIAEPESCNTAPAVALTVSKILERSDDELIVILPSDHFIPDAEKFLTVLCSAFEYAQSNDELVLLGVEPNYPATGYGYIQVQDDVELGGFRVKSFHEKPKQETAQHYVNQKNYYWNIGIVVGRASIFKKEFKKHAPGMYTSIEAAASITKAYQSIEALSFDMAVLEKSSNVVMFAWQGAWYDIGNVHTFLSVQQQFGMQQPQTISVRGGNNLVSSSKKIVACVGVHDLCIIETKDALLVASKNDVEAVREVAQKVLEQES